MDELANQDTPDPSYWEISDDDIAVGGVIVAECANGDDANFLRRVLEENGVRSVAFTPGGRFDLRPPQVRVAPADEQKARFVLAQPITPGKREQWEAEVEVQVEPEPDPVCPKCGAADLTLQSVDEVNHWLCETCGTKYDQQLTPL